MTNISLQLIDNDYERLDKRARQLGKSVQALIYDWISQLPDDEEFFDVTGDPVFTMEGYESKAPVDLAANLDKYIYGENKSK